jgi:hypothetical protein
MDVRNTPEGSKTAVSSLVTAPRCSLHTLERFLQNAIARSLRRPQGASAVVGA